MTSEFPLSCCSSWEVCLCVRERGVGVCVSVCVTKALLGFLLRPSDHAWPRVWDLEMKRRVESDQSVPVGSCVCLGFFRSRFFFCPI